MLRKLNQLGISGRFYNWTQRFLSIRTLHVKVGDKNSKCIDVASGVPQVSVLGPVLFLLFINRCLKLLENIQMRSTKSVEGLQDTESEEMAKWLNLDSLPSGMDKGEMKPQRRTNVRPHPGD